MRPRALVICACSWSGELAGETPCPSCGRPAMDRLDHARVAVLRRVQEHPMAELHRTQRLALIRIGVLTAVGPRPPAYNDGKKRPPPVRTHAVTPAGVKVLAAAAVLGW